MSTYELGLEIETGVLILGAIYATTLLGLIYWLA